MRSAGDGNTGDPCTALPFSPLCAAGAPRARGSAQARLGSSQASARGARKGGQASLRMSHPLPSGDVLSRVRNGPAVKWEVENLS